MSITFRILLMVLSILCLIYVLRKIGHSKLQIEHAIFWIICATCFVILAIFPQLVYWITGLLGMMSPANAVFLCIIAVLLLRVFLLTIELSTLENKVKELAQAVALSNQENSEQPEEGE